MHLLCILVRESELLDPDKPRTECATCRMYIIHSEPSCYVSQGEVIVFPHLVDCIFLFLSSLLMCLRIVAHCISICEEGSTYTIASGF